MKILLIRHGKTAGNEEKRYVGSTDEGLSEKGIEELQFLRKTINNLLEKYKYSDDHEMPNAIMDDEKGGIKHSRNSSYSSNKKSLILISSPMKRCLETTEILFSQNDADLDIHIEKDLRECDFGLFECKNYQELSGDPHYQAWIDSEGELAFPEGESPRAFRERCISGFRKVMDRFYSEEKMCVFTVHGGTIMSVMEKMAKPPKAYFDWQIGNGHGFLCDFDKAAETIEVIESF